jgi:tetratricopeptide (TPR) repeat protein
MQNKTVPELFSMVKENLFRLGEKKHLNAMKQHSKQREHQPHADLLSKMQDSPRATAHQQCIEHQGLKFWSYYFKNEKPQLDEPLPDYLNQAWDEKLNILAHIIEPPLTKIIPELDGLGQTEAEIAKQWVRAFTLAEAAFAAGEFSVAEAGYREALMVSEKSDNKRTRKMAVAAKGLADALLQQNRVEEADPFYSLALTIDEEILGSGEAGIEDEFYSIARHFFEEGKCEQLELIFDDLLERLRMSVGRNDPMTARCFNELGILYCSEQKWQLAETAFLHALEILEKHSPAPARQLAAVHNNCASLFEACNRPEDAKFHYEKSLELLSASINPKV